MDLMVSLDMQKDFQANGYVIMRGLLDSEEVSLLRQAIDHPNGVMSQTFDVNDKSKNKISVSLWAHPGNDVTGIIAKSDKVAGVMEQLLGGEVYQYHGKVIQKDPQTGGAHHWHQDYGYWYHNGNLHPDMGTVWIAVDKATRQNSCLQLLKGSHLAGRIDHVGVQGEGGHSGNEQVVADPGRVKHLRNCLEHIYFEADPGDAIFFHCNVLHRSEANMSNDRRTAYLVAYNRRDNSSVIEHQFPQYAPLQKVRNDVIKKCTNFTNLGGKNFIMPGKTKFVAQDVLGDRGKDTSESSKSDS